MRRAAGIFPDDFFGLRVDFENPGSGGGTAAVVYAILRSRHGLALSAIRESEPAASSLGVRNFMTKFWIYFVAPFGTGITGALIYFQISRVSPDAAFSVIDWTAFVVFIIVIGGIVFLILQNYLSDFGTWYLMLLGV